MHDFLLSQGLVVNEKRVRRLLRLMGIMALYPKRNLSKLGQSEYVRPYLLKGLKISYINQVWAIGIIYIPMTCGFLYLTAIIDLYSRFVVGWSVHNTLEAAHCKEVLSKAIACYRKPGIVNSDQGSQFTCALWTEYLGLSTRIIKISVNLQLDKIGYKLDIPNKINNKLEFQSVVYRKINQLLGAIDTFKGSWKVLEQTKSGYLKELRKIATIESIGSSTRIEGATLTDKEVEKLLKSVKISKLEKRDEQEVVGYYEALEVILDNYIDISLTQNYIHQLHGILLKHSNKDQTHKGRFKNLSNQVVANYPDGIQRTIFRTTDPHLTASEMESLLLWTNERLKEKDLHPLMIVATFVYEFLFIHPYQDGNGRLSRLLTTFLLLKLDYQFVQYVSFEHVIENKKEAYYGALMDGQKNRYTEEERIDKWMMFFLDSLIELTKRLEAKYETYSKLKLVLNDRQQQIIAFVKEQKTVQIKQIEAELSSYSRNTIKKDLSYLVDESLLLKTGAGRGVKYHIKE